MDKKDLEKKGKPVHIKIQACSLAGKGGMAIETDIPEDPQTEAECAGSLAIKMLDVGIESFCLMVLPKILKDRGIDLDSAMVELKNILSNMETNTKTKSNGTFH